MAGVDSEKRRFTEQHPPRPPIQSQHSSSVPSTPYQQPRDLRFHSRSPSPGRGLNNNSPRSVVSEVVTGQQGNAQRSQPVVCKFETGAEIRKRRIPYVDGGNEELGPPKKELKKTLEPEEQEKLKGQMDELYQRLLPSDESEDRRARLVKKLDRILNAEWPGSNICVNVFGSSGNLLSSSDSDVDICITTTRKQLESMHGIATLLHKNGMEKVVCRASAKVPIVKCWDPELELAADLNVNNPLALENTRMIKTYVQLDPRVRPLAKIIKYWTKRRILNDAAFGGTISSYTWICMIISFLQRRDPPILPSLQKLADEQKSCKKQDTPSQDTPRFADDVKALQSFGEGNKETLPELLFSFFRHYGYEFEYSKYVVSVKEARLLLRKEKGWDPSNYTNKEAQNRLCVEEPFTVIRNLGNSADDYAWSGIHGEIRRAFDLLADGCQLEKCCEQYEFPPDEKPIFQRPAPKPKPTLTRSASQSGRSSHEPGSGRSRKGGNRNQSAQRAGNRRASSGASFSNQRVPLPFQSPPLGGSVVDYFGLKGDLHNQLFQQWQYLQAQTEALKSQLAAQQQQHQQSTSSQSQSRANDLSASPHHRSYQNGLPSPRYLDNPPSTAPLLPGYLYHYPQRYPPASPMSQARTREGGTSINPSSPSLVAAVPALRRQVHRTSIPENSTSVTRSQSQPGRSLPHPLQPFNTQQNAHPGFDVSGAMPLQHQAMRSSSGIYTAGPAGMPFPPSSMAGYPSLNGGVEHAMPKEYVGYYVGQSPSLGPQYAGPIPPMPTAPMTLQNPPTQRQRRVTPDLHPPLPNGRHNSRSPSPLGHLRSYSTTGDLRAVQTQRLQSPPKKFDAPLEKPATAPASAVEPPEVSGPLIVNGSGTGTSTAAARTSSAEQASQIPPVPPIPHQHSTAATASIGHANGSDLSRVQSLPTRPKLDTSANVKSPDQQQSEPTTATLPISPSPRMKSGPKLNLSPNGTPVGPNGTTEHFHESTPISSAAAPLLSPVAELRTPSPTRPHVFERDSPSANGLAKKAGLANAKNADRNGGENVPPNSLPAAPSSPAAARHERKGSLPASTASAVSGKPARSPPVATPSIPPFSGTSGATATPAAPPPTSASSWTNAVNGTAVRPSSSQNVPQPAPSQLPTQTQIPLPSQPQNPNPWQQATRKGHKKSKSTSLASPTTSSGSGFPQRNPPTPQGQPLPVNEAERKGG